MNNRITFTVWVKVFVCGVLKNPGWIGPGWKHPKENRRTDGSSLSSLVEYFLAFVYLFLNSNASNAVFAVFQPFLLVCESVFTPRRQKRQNVEAEASEAVDVPTA